MPELPEVETVRRGLAPALEGRRIARATVRRGDLRRPFPNAFAHRLEGRLVRRVKRRAKYLLADLDGGETLIMHLGMSGRFTVHRATETKKPGRFVHKPADDGSGTGKHDHVILETDEGTRIVYTDHRRFGLMLLADTATLEEHPLFAEIGPEPLDRSFTPALLSAALKGKRTPIKSALLDQRVVAGLGNIYVCEALFRAGISPKRMASSVAGARADKLVPAIKQVLRQAVAAGGSSISDYAHADGELGDYQYKLFVYDREGEPCRKTDCSGKVRRLVQSGRSSFFCSTCQR
jgi:formamidopyrimidine-DNA glycosylase